MWLTALLMGLAGSLHCVAMCSPLAIAVTNLRRPFLVNRILYNGGRILTYGMLGALVSTFGSLFKLSGFQNILTIGLGCLLVMLGLTGISHLRIPFFTGIIQKFTLKIKQFFSEFLKKKSFFSIGMMGMLNGLLPCGLTYLALTYCLTLSGGIDGFFFMLIFGAGTLPVMIGLSSVFQFMINRWKLNFRSLTTMVMLALGVLLITRSIYGQHHAPVISGTVENIVVCK